LNKNILLLKKKKNLDSVIVCLSSVSNELEVMDTTNTQMSASYLDLQPEIDKGGR
jgi:hypothetical protein